MTEKQLRDLVAKWQTRLGLDEWRIAVKLSDSVEIEGHQVFMRTHRSSFYKRATIEVGRYALEPSLLPECIEKDLLNDGVITHNENVEISVAHELLHCLLRDLMEASDLIREHLSPMVIGVWDAAWRKHEEELAEGLAISLVKNWNK